MGLPWSDYAWQVLSGVLFINRLWFCDVTQGSDLPYWSLGYEVPYYVIFGLAMFAGSRWRWPSVIAALVVVGPRIAGLLPLWLAGVGAYRVCARRPPGQMVGAVLCAGSFCAWTGYEVMAWRGERWGEITQDYLVGCLFAVHLIGFRSVSSWAARPLSLVAVPLRWLAGATLSIYLFHLPVAQFLGAVAARSPSSPGARLVVFGGTLLAVFALAEITERKRAAWRRAVAMLWERVASAWSATGGLDRV